MTAQARMCKPGESLGQAVDELLASDKAAHAARERLRDAAPTLLAALKEIADEAADAQTTTVPVGKLMFVLVTAKAAIAAAELTEEGSNGK